MSNNHSLRFKASVSTTVYDTIKMNYRTRLKVYMTTIYKTTKITERRKAKCFIEICRRQVYWVNSQDRNV